MIQLSDTIKHLIIINVLFFIATVTIQQFPLHEILSMHYIESPYFKPYQTLTYMFMHGSPMHLFFNMLGIVFFGPRLELLWGRNRFLFFYIVTGIGAGLIYQLTEYIYFNNLIETISSITNQSKTEILSYFNDTLYNANIPESETALLMYGGQMVGASGALFGILTAFAIQYPNEKIMLLFFPVPIAMKYFIPVIVVGDLISGLTGQPIFNPSNVAYFAHVGGAVIGLIIALTWKKNNYQQF